MTNPFQAFDISDDQQDQFVGSKTDKVRKTHKQRRQLKKQATQEPTVPVVSTQGVNSQVPVRVRDNAKQVRHNRSGRPTKGVPQGHPLDRHSGTGRQDRPRKQGGGRGNFGSVKDELNKEKYQKPQQQVPTTVTQQEKPVQQTKPEQPQAPTLAQYYQSRGINLTVSAGQKKGPVKNQVNADWLKKQKLTLIETKQDKRKTQTLKQNVTIHNNTRVEMDLGNNEILGFGQKPVQKPKEQEHQKDHKDRGQGYKGKKASKVVLKEDDFPTL